MVDRLVPFAYVVVIGFVAFQLVNAAAPDDARRDGKSFILFAIVNLAGFMANSYLVFISMAAVAVFFLSRRDPVGRIATFLFLFPVIPLLGYPIEIPGIPALYATWTRLLVAILLLPLFVGSLRSKPLTHYPVDKYILLFFAVNALFSFRDVEFTVGVRGSFYLFLDVVVPYYVLSRQLRSLDDIRHVLFAFTTALVIAGLVNIFETGRYWHVYGQMFSLTDQIATAYDTRAGLLRAYGPLGRPSVSAFALATGLGLLWSLSPYFNKRTMVVGVGCILATGLLVTFSRGSWAAALIIGGAWLFTSNKKQFIRALAMLVVVVALFLLSDLGGRILDLLPFIGDETSHEAATVEYRRVLLETSLKVAIENPLFGSTRFDQHPDMVAITQASGLLDIVNHYLLVLLNFGLVGLLSFLGIFMSTLYLLKRMLDRTSSEDASVGVFLKAFFWTILGNLVAIATTSAVGKVGLILWCLVALVAASSGAIDSTSSNERPAAKGIGIGL